MKKSITMGVLIATVLFGGTAFAVVQDKPQQKCINAMNKGMAKVSKAQLKANVKCISDFAKAKNMSATACYQLPAKVTEAQGKNCEQDAKKCTTLPTLGATGCGSVNNYSQYNAHEVADDMIGSDAGVAICATDKPGCKCQGKALKAANKLFSTHQKEFNKCKKSGLKHKTMPFDDVTDLNGCLSVDPKLKISKAVTKLEGAIAKSCPGTITNPFPAGVCPMLTGAALGDCIEERVRCGVCIAAQGSDNLTIDCDIYDDATDDGSCFDDF